MSKGYEYLRERLPDISGLDDLDGTITNFMREIIHWRWDELLALQYDEDTLSVFNSAMAIIETCASGRNEAIRAIFERLEGKPETPIRVIPPKFYIRYPNATNDEELQYYLDMGDGTNETNISSSGTSQKSRPKLNISELSLQDTLRAMLGMPNKAVGMVLRQREMTEEMFYGRVGKSPQLNIPFVKSVIAASLINKANNERSFSSLNLLIERIEGKVEETLKVIGADTFIDDYSEKAPLGSVLINGQWCYENKEVSDQWKQGYLASRKMKGISEG